MMLPDADYPTTYKLRILEMIDILQGIYFEGYDFVDVKVKDHNNITFSPTMIDGEKQRKIPRKLSQDINLKNQR